MLTYILSQFIFRFKTEIRVIDHLSCYKFDSTDGVPFTMFQLRFIAGKHSD